MKQNYIEVERSVEYRNYQREVAIVSDFFYRNTVERSKNEEINIKKAKNFLKSQVLCVNFQLETHFQALQNTVVSISEVDISI